MLFRKIKAYFLVYANTLGALAPSEKSEIPRPAVVVEGQLLADITLFTMTQCIV
jgi:hypothetical protein